MNPADQLLVVRLPPSSKLLERKKELPELQMSILRIFFVPCSVIKLCTSILLPNYIR
jgi:hypothetical protein